MDNVIYRRSYLRQRRSDPVRDDYVFDMAVSPSGRMYAEDIPGRREELPEFLDFARNFCDEYEYNLEIHEVSNGVVLQLSLDIGQFTDGRLNRLIGMADDIEIATGVVDRDLTIYLRYCVQAFYKDGERIFPEILGH